MADAIYERVSLVKQEVFVFRLPPMASNRGHKAADWNLDKPDWTGRMRLISLADALEIRLEDKTSGELFAKCPIDVHPGTAIQPVLDSSRYFVIKLKNDDGQSAFIGMGFTDRSDSFDLNVALSDHFKGIERENELNKAANAQNQQKLDLAFKEGQTITINFGKKSERSAKNQSCSGASETESISVPPLLPPPPSSSSVVNRR